MFYRLATQLDLTAKISPKSNKVGEFLYFSDFEDLFVRVLLNPKWPYCEMYMAPKIDCGKYYSDLILPDTSKLGLVPDMWTVDEAVLVTEKVKAVIEKLDDVSHQFWPARLLSESGMALDL